MNSPGRIGSLSRLLRGAAAAVFLLLLPALGLAEPLDYYSGYTRPGFPDADTDKATIKAAGIEDVKEGIADTVYFRVFDTTEGTKEDPFGVGIPNLAEAFVPGYDPVARIDSPKLDTSARYIYLYQVVYDSKRTGLMRTASVHLIVPPADITSWGHFAAPMGDKDKEREKAKAKEKEPLRVGLGFTLRTGEGEKAAVIPVSVEHQGVQEGTEYRDYSPHYPRPKNGVYSLSRIALNNIAGADPVVEDTGREPERVMLIQQAGMEPFRRRAEEDARSRRLLAQRLVEPLLAVGPRGGFDPITGLYLTDPFEFRAAEVAAEQPRYSGAVRAYYLDRPLAPGERSTIFGFTSNLPPTYDYARTSGVPKGKIGGAFGPAGPLDPRNLYASSAHLGLALAEGPAGPVDPRSDPIRAAGEVPTPIPPPAAVGGAGVGGLPLGALGGTSGLSGGGGLGGGLGGTGGLGSFPGNLGGGVFPTGSNGGGGNGNGTPGVPTVTTTGGTVTPAVIPGPIPETPDIAINVTGSTQSQTQSQQQKQKQKQQQQQQQQQSQQCNCNNSPAIVPEPPAYLSALLGLPLFVLIGLSLRRHRPAAPAAPAA